MVVEYAVMDSVLPDVPVLEIIVMVCFLLLVLQAPLIALS